jgi:hypothetical protein
MRLVRARCGGALLTAVEQIMPSAVIDCRRRLDDRMTA